MADIPPWLAPQPITQMHAQGARMGLEFASEAARLQHQRQQLDQQMRLTQMEISARQEQQARQDLVRQQQLEIEKSYKEQMLSMKQQELAQQAEQLQLKTMQAAEQFAARQRFQDMIQRAGEGANIPQIAFQSGLGNTMTGQGVAALYKAGLPKPPAPPPFVPNQVEVGGHTLTQMSPNRYSQLREDKPMGQATIPEEMNIAGQPFATWTQPSGNREIRQVRTPKQSEAGVSPRDRLKLAELQKQRTLLMSNHVPIPPKKKERLEAWQKERDRIEELNRQIESLISVESETSTGSTNKLGNYTWEVVDEEGGSDED